MSTSISATTATGATAAAPSTVNANTTDPTTDRFLKLLIAQMKNQDPLNPLDNAQVTSQMAQISTVQGISQLNTSMTAMLGQYQGSQAISLPGRQVLIDGNSLALATTATGASATGGFNLAQDASNVGVDVKDSTGAIVAHMNLGAQTAGPGSFVWNGALASGGTAAAGNYTFAVSAANGSVAAPVTPLMAARVTGTAITSQGMRLSLDGMASRYYSDVRMVL
jgi:flagellar basal-body rod modification protein FlgD